MHVTHLDDHALALSSYGVRVLFGPEPPPHGGTALEAAPRSTFGSCSAPSRLRKEVPPQAAALRAKSPLAASSIPPCTIRRAETRSGSTVRVLCGLKRLRMVEPPCRRQEFYLATGTPGRR